MKRLSRLLGVLLFVVPLGAAEDFTGIWAGSFVVTRPDGVGFAGLAQLFLCLTTTRST